MTFENGLLGFSVGTSPSKSLQAKVGEKPLPVPPERPNAEEIFEVLVENGVERELAAAQAKYFASVDPANPPSEPPPGWPKDQEWPFGLERR